MRNIFLVIVMSFIGITNMNSQNEHFNFGVSIGNSMDDPNDIFVFVIDIEANYLFEISDVFQIGPSGSYLNYRGRKYDDAIINGIKFEGYKIKDVIFFPISIATRFNIGEKFTLGANVGYAIGVDPDNNNGGFYFRPSIGYTFIESFVLQASYSNVVVNNVLLDSPAIGIVLSL